MYMNTHTDTCTCACTCVSLFFLLCGAVSCRVSRVIVGWVVGCGVVWCCRHVVVVVVFVLVSWSLSLRRHRKIEEGKEMARRSLNK